MLKDMEENRIEMAEIPNGHILTWGQSGQGKTFFTCRKIEQEAVKGKRILTLDFSGSYSENELIKNKVKLGEDLEIKDLSEKELYWRIPCNDKKNFVSILAGALAECLEIGSYYQMKWLKKAIGYHMEEHLFFSISSFMHSLEHWMDAIELGGNSVLDKDNLAHLLSRLMPYENLCNLQIYYTDRGMMRDVPWKPVTVVQISRFADKERRFLASMMLHLIWAETRMYNESKRFDMLVLDEVQFLSLKSNSPFSAMLREGRKYGISLMVATQFLSAYDKEELETLMQAGHFLIFKPSPNDIRFSAKMIAQEGSSEWKKILENLQIGQAVLVGSYHINENTNVAVTPVVCQIENTDL